MNGHIDTLCRSHFDRHGERSADAPNVRNLVGEVTRLSGPSAS